MQATYGVSATTLKLSDGASVDELRRAVSVSLAWRKSDSLTFETVLGASLSGSMTIGAQRYEIRPGGLAGVAATWRIVDGKGAVPFVLMSLAFTGSIASTGPSGTDGSAALGSIDFRGGLVTGKTFFDVLSPYAAVRLFGGPVIWRHAGAAVVGGDLYHVQIGAGLVTALPRAMNLFAEIDPLGERAVTIGGGKSF